MIKDFNSFITEDKEYNEIFTLVEEVLSNDYSNREIEESFDEFNLLLESISMDDIKKYVNIAKSDENLQKLFKMRDDFKKDYDSLEKELIKSLEDKKISREEFREKLQANHYIIVLIQLREKICIKMMMTRLGVENYVL